MLGITKYKNFWLLMIIFILSISIYFIKSIYAEINELTQCKVYGAAETVCSTIHEKDSKLGLHTNKPKCLQLCFDDNRANDAASQFYSYLQGICQYPNCNITYANLNHQGKLHGTLRIESTKEGPQDNIKSQSNSSFSLTAYDENDFPKVDANSESFSQDVETLEEDSFSSQLFSYLGYEKLDYRFEDSFNSEITEEFPLPNEIYDIALTYKEKEESTSFHNNWKPWQISIIKDLNHVIDVIIYLFSWVGIIIIFAVLFLKLYNLLHELLMNKDEPES